MIKVGITGGIGSGKSIICQVFSALGALVFNADEAARFLMEYDPQLIGAIKKLLGDSVYINDKLDRGKISSIVFNDPSKLKAFNALVHPATIRYGNEWMNRQQGPYVLKEAAIIFETGANTGLDFIIGVFAPMELRIKRVMARSGHSREKVVSIIANQMDETEKMKLCDIIIVNDDAKAVLPQVIAAHEQLLRMSGKEMNIK